MSEELTFIRRVRGIRPGTTGEPTETIKIVSTFTSVNTGIVEASESWRREEHLRIYTTASAGEELEVGDEITYLAKKFRITNKGSRQTSGETFTEIIATIN